MNIEPQKSLDPPLLPGQCSISPSPKGPGRPSFQASIILRRPMITTANTYQGQGEFHETQWEGSGPPFETAINRTANPIPSHPSESQIRFAWCNHTGNNVNSQAASGSSQVRVTVANRKRTWKTPGQGEERQGLEKRSERNRRKGYCVFLKEGTVKIRKVGRLRRANVDRANEQTTLAKDG